MKKTSIRWRIFTYNLAMILLLMALITVIFNISVGRYFERSITGQMEQIAQRAEDLALLKGPAFFQPQGPGLPESMEPRPAPPQQDRFSQDVTMFYFMMERSLREPLSVLDADFILLDKTGSRISVPQDQFFRISSGLEEKLKQLANDNEAQRGSVIFAIEDTRYITVVKPVSNKNTFGLGWVILYSSLERVEKIKTVVNVILLSILAFSAVVMMLFSSHTAEKVCAPFAQLDHHIKVLAERKFGERLTLPVDEELKGLVDTVNHLSEMLESHDKAQKTFLQNVSHEFRTPIMAIQSHAEGIRHHVIDTEAATDIILAESQRLTRLVENLLYLSRLDALEEVYEFKPVEINALVASCAERMQGVAEQAGVSLVADLCSEELWVAGDDEKLSIAVENLISNGVRYASGVVRLQTQSHADGLITITVSDDGEGIDAEDLPHLFERFYRGRKGRFGLGLAIVKAVADRHHSAITAENTTTGAVFRLTLKKVDDSEGRG